jgi:ribonuclease G
VVAAPRVIQYILEEEPAGIAELEENIGKTIELRSEDQYGQDQFDVVLF